MNTAQAVSKLFDDDDGRKSDKRKDTKMYKIVDVFNGHENPERFRSLEDAEIAWARDREAFKANPANTNCKYCGEIVHADAVWTWDERYSMYLWTVD